LEPNRIPFLMITKAKLPLKAKQGSHVDIASTLLNLANLPTPPYYMGKSFLSNPDPIPVGQDRENGYMIVDGRFFPLSLDPDIQELNQEEPLRDFGLKISQSPDESQAPQAPAIEGETRQSQKGVYFKWYYNQYFNLE